MTAIYPLGGDQVVGFVVGPCVGLGVGLTVTFGLGLDVTRILQICVVSSFFSRFSKLTPIFFWVVPKSPQIDSIVDRISKETRAYMHRTML